MTTLPNNTLYLPRNNTLHWSCYVTWTGGKLGNTSTSGKRVYIDRFFLGNDNLNTKAIQFGSYIMELMEFEPEHPLVADIPRHPHIEYDLNCMVGDVPINTHPDSVDIDNTLGVYEYKTALEHRAWNSRMVYKQKQISFYQMCIRELKGEWNPQDNFIVEIPTKRIATETDENGVEWDIVERGDKYLEVTRDTLEDGSYMPTKMHRRLVTKEEIDRLKDDVIRVGHEISDCYKQFLEEQMNQII